MNAIFYRKSTKNLHESQCTHFFEIFSPQMLLKMWNSESPWKTTKKKCFQNRFLTPGRPPNSSLKALSAFIVASRTCEIFGPFRVRACVSCLASRFRPFGVVRTKNASRDKRKKCWRKIFFLLARPPLACYGTFQEQSWQHADNFQVCTRTFFSCPFFGFSERRDFPAHFSVWENVVANVGILNCFRNHVMSCHLISSHLTDAGTHRQWSLILLKTSGVRARYASPSFWNGQLKFSCILGWSEKIVFQVWIQCFWVWVVEEHFIFKFAHGFYDPLYIILF